MPIRRGESGQFCLSINGWAQEDETGSMNRTRHQSILAAYLIVVMLWYLGCHFTDGPFAFYGSIAFFLFHFPGLIIAKRFYVYHVGEPACLSHLVEGFMIAVNFGILWLILSLTRKRKKEAQPPAAG